MNKENKGNSDLIEAVKEFLKKPFGRLTIEKHENQLYLEITDKKKLTLT